MKNTYLLLSLILFITTSCGVTKYQKNGTVAPENFSYETKFTTYKGLIVIPSKINNISKNFVFDTGARLSSIQRDSIIGPKITVHGAHNTSIEAGSEIVNSFKIGNVEFIKTYGVNLNMIELKEEIPDFGGIIGQPIIEKANWLIDYPNKSLSISNKNLIDKTFKSINLKRKDGAPYTYISINGTKYKVLIDLGSSFEISLPKESNLAKSLLEQYEFKENEREGVSIVGFQTVKEKVGVVPRVQLANEEFKNVTVNIGINSEPSIGIGFFRNCIIYIDNLKNDYKFNKIQ